MKNTTSEVTVSEPQTPTDVARVSTATMTHIDAPSGEIEQQQEKEETAAAVRLYQVDDDDVYDEELIVVLDDDNDVDDVAISMDDIAARSGNGKILPCDYHRQESGSGDCEHEEDNLYDSIKYQVAFDRSIKRSVAGNTNNNSTSGNIPIKDVSSLHRMQKFFVKEVLGKGPARFALGKGDDIKTDLANLTKPQRQAFDDLKTQFETYLESRIGAGRSKRMTSSSGALAAKDFVIKDEWYLRYLHDTSKVDSSEAGPTVVFRPDRAFKSMRKKVFKQSGRYLTLRIHKLETQLRTRTLFPVPGLKTSHSDQPLDMFYMRPALYFPKETSTKMIIDNLVYVMNTMVEGTSPTRHGVGFIANMNNWQFKNFDTNYCLQFMQALQGMMVPVKVELFLIVNPPAWFGAIWKIMRPMLVPSFRRKVKICTESQLPKYLQKGYEAYLPDDFETGRASTKNLVEDFITYRRYVERDYNEEADGTDLSFNNSYDDGLDNGSVVSGRTNGSLERSLGRASQAESIDSADREIDDSDDDDASINADIDEELDKHLRDMDNYFGT
jgi:hypothetical protein